jgi:hypothetical protein
MPENTRTFIWCGRQDGAGHVVGELGWTKVDRGWISALLLYEQSLDAPPDQIPLLRMEAILGTVKGVHCTCCQNRFDWYFGQASMSRMARLITERGDGNNA